MKGETKGASHLEELEGPYLMKGREIVFHSGENKTERGSRDDRNTRLMSRHTSLGLKTSTIPALATISCLCNKAV